MEQLKSEQIRVQAEERRKTLSEETRQHQAVRAAGGGRGAGVRHGPEAQSGAVLGPLRPRGGLAHAAGPRNPSELSVTGARVSACALSDSAGGAGGSSDPSAQSAVQWRARPRCPRPPASAAEHAHAAPSFPQRAQYQDKLARQRYEDQLKQQVSLAPARQGRRRDPQEPHVVQAGCASRPLPRCCAAEAGGHRPPGAPSWDPTGDLAVTGLWGGGGSDVSACHEHYSF